MTSVDILFRQILKQDQLHLFHEVEHLKLAIEVLEIDIQSRSLFFNSFSLTFIFSWILGVLNWFNTWSGFTTFTKESPWWALWGTPSLLSICRDSVVEPFDWRRENGWFSLWPICHLATSDHLAFLPFCLFSGSVTTASATEPRAPGQYCERAILDNTGFYWVILGNTG